MRADRRQILTLPKVLGELRATALLTSHQDVATDRALRELKIGEGGLAVGRPLTAFSCILTGNPVFEREEQKLMPAVGHKKELDGHS